MVTGVMCVMCVSNKTLHRFIAGGFIYIATVTVIPELLEGTQSLIQGLKEVAALSVGIGLMVLIAEYE